MWVSESKLNVSVSDFKNGLKFHAKNKLEFSASIFTFEPILHGYVIRIILFVLCRPDYTLTLTGIVFVA